jgi:serine/threonine protein kinase
VGITIFAMMFGYLPFPGRNVFELFENIRTAEIKFPATVEEIPENEDITDEMFDTWKDAVRRLLAKKPADRLTLKELRAHSVCARRGTLYSCNDGKVTSESSGQVFGKSLGNEKVAGFSRRDTVAPNNGGTLPDPALDQSLLHSTLMKTNPGADGARSDSEEQPTGEALGHVSGLHWEDIAQPRDSSRLVFVSEKRSKTIINKMSKLCGGPSSPLHPAKTAAPPTLLPSSCEDNSTRSQSKSPLISDRTLPRQGVEQSSLVAMISIEAATESRATFCGTPGEENDVREDDFNEKS